MFVKTVKSLAFLTRLVPIALTPTFQQPWKQPYNHGSYGQKQPSSIGGGIMGLELPKTQSPQNCPYYTCLAAPWKKKPHSQSMSLFLLLQSTLGKTWPVPKIFAKAISSNCLSSQIQYQLRQTRGWPKNLKIPLGNKMSLEDFQFLVWHVRNLEVAAPS